MEDRMRCWSCEKALETDDIFYNRCESCLSPIFQEKDTISLLAKIYATLMTIQKNNVAIKGNGDFQRGYLSGRGRGYPF